MLVKCAYFHEFFGLTKFSSYFNQEYKQAELELFLDNQDIHLLIGTESHLNDTIFDSEVFPRNYSVFRKDRNIHEEEYLSWLKNPYHHQF